MLAPPRRPPLLTPRARIWLASVAIAFVAWFVVTLFFGQLARRHGEIFMWSRLEFFFFTFTPLKRAGLDGLVALRASELIFGVLVFLLSTITLSALLRWRSRARHRRLAR